jgi:predicted N-formylglutamate amidohydrolase
MKTKMYDIFFKIIKKYLDDPNRSLNKNWIEVMCKELQQHIPNSELEEIERLDRYNMGYVDYHHKFALYLDRLYQEKLK